MNFELRPQKYKALPLSRFVNVDPKAKLKSVHKFQRIQDAELLGRCVRQVRACFCMAACMAAYYHAR